MDYLDFGSSDSDNEDDAGMACELDSDEEEQYENKRLMKMFNLHEPPSKSQRSIQDFEAEMEAELDRRALEVEAQGGMEHQKSLSRSSSTTSLNKSPRASPVPGSSASISGGVPKKSCVKRPHSALTEPPPGSRAKSVRFAEPTPSEPSKSTSVTPAVAGSTTVSEDTTVTAAEKRAKDMYDELYFDSDESDGEDEEKRSRKENRRRFMTNDELFYDPSSDDKDQAWIDKQRKNSYGESNVQEGPTAGSSREQGSNSNQNPISDPPNNSNSSNQVPLPSTDAVLNCPACFTTVCHDCQRHEMYVGQYRAMFVVNCIINPQETLTVPEKPPKKFRKKGNNGANIRSQFTPTSSSDVFHPVICKICRTQVAMYDSEEVYHFFNVLASQP